MLSENIQAIRKSKGLSQEELAVKLNVVRQTISKWEEGLSVPDADMLISLSEALETPASTLLGEYVVEAPIDDLRALSEKLEVVNLQLACRKAARLTTAHWLLVSLCATLVLVSAALVAMNSPYLGWDFTDPETAVRLSTCSNGCSSGWRRSPSSRRSSGSSSRGRRRRTPAAPQRCRPRATCV